MYAAGSDPAALDTLEEAMFGSGSGGSFTGGGTPVKLRDRVAFFTAFKGLFSRPASSSMEI